MITVDWRVIGQAVSAALLLSVPLAVIGGVFNWTWIGVLLWFAWFAAGGIAASKRLDLPFSHGLIAGMATYLVTQPIGILFAVAREKSLTPAAWVFNAMLAAALGLLGGKYSQRRAAADAR